MQKLLIKNFKKRRNLLIFLTLLLLLSLILPLGYSSTKESILKYRIRGPRISRITHEITVLNKGKLPLKNIKIWVPIIKNETPYHFVLINDIMANLPYKDFENDSSNNTYIFWQINSILPGNIFKARIEYSILSFDVQYVIDAHLVGNYSKESWLYGNYTQPEQYIESDDPLIKEVAQALAENETNPHILASKITDFVSKHLKYTVQGEEKGARWALEHGEGDCSEFSYLFTALCRACGIPAKVKAGFAFHSNTETTEFGHMWAEYYLPNYGWIPVDLTWHQVCYQDSLHFGLLHSFPLKYPYDTVFIECSVPSVNIEIYQTVKINSGSIAAFENFSLANLTYDTICKTETIESLYFLTTMMGARIFSPKDYKNLENAIKEFDLTVQQSLETKDLNGLKQANIQIEYILGLAEAIIFKCEIMLALTVLIITLIVFAISSKKRKIEACSTL